MKNLLKQLKYYFSFSTGELKGVLVLISLIFILLIFNILNNSKHNGKHIINNNDLDNEIALFEAAIDTTAAKNENQKDYIVSAYPIDNVASLKLHPFPFNPNELKRNEWQKLGLSNKQINVIENYLKKGGKFYKKEDFKKMFCISADEYDVLESYINIPEAPASKKYSYENKSKPAFIVELNQADTNDMMEIKGIGPGFARKIAKYRELLGGFVSKEQLLEVYGMDSSRYNQIQGFITINSSMIKKININKADIKELKKHPYFDYYTAKSIVMYRLKNGDYKNVEEIRKANLIYEDFYKRIYPYLTVN